MSAFDLDLTGDTTESLEMGTPVTPGWYRAVLDDVKEESDKFRFVLIFRVTHGASINQQQSYYINHPSHADDPARALGRVKMVAQRLGLIGEADMGKAKSIDFNDAIGLPVFLFVKETPGKDGKPPFIGIEYSGVYATSHPLDKLPKHFPEEFKRFRTGGTSAPVQTPADGATRPAAAPKPAATVPAARPSRKTVGVDDL